MWGVSGLRGILEVLLFQLKMSKERHLSVCLLGPDWMAVPGPGNHAATEFFFAARGCACKGTSLRAVPSALPPVGAHLAKGGPCPGPSQSYTLRTKVPALWGPPGDPASEPTLLQQGAVLKEVCRLWDSSPGRPQSSAVHSDGSICVEWCMCFSGSSGQTEPGWAPLGHPCLLGEVLAAAGTASRQS